MMNQRLGLRALILYIIKGLLPGIIFGILTVVVLSAKNLIIGSFVNSGYASVDVINKIILFVIGGMYIVSILLLVFGLLINLIHYFSCVFGMDDYGFKMHRGLISRDEVSIPYHQIQDVDVDQSVIGRLFGVGKLIVLTAGNEDKDKQGEENEIVFGIIDIAIAKMLQKQLVEKSSIQLVRQAPGN